MESAIVICLLAVQSIFILIHIGVLLRLIPYQSVWGGRLKSDKEMYRFEAIALLLSAVFLWITLEKTGCVPGFLPETIAAVLMGVTAAFFCLNVLGNLLSKNKTEKILFTPLALIAAVCGWIVTFS